MESEKIIIFTRPRLTASISLTGAKCDRLCPYCRGQYIRNMFTVDDLDKILSGDYKSVLISGGYDSEGRIPVFEHLDVLKRIKSAGLRINLHPGKLDISMAGKLKGLVDVISQDLGGLPPAEDAEFYTALNEIVPTVPHLLLGRWGADLFEEMDYLEVMGDLPRRPDRLVFLVLIPKNSAPPPSLGRLKEVFGKARKFLPETEFYLGCMRPGGTYREKLDRMCIELGFSRIVNPARSIKEDYLKKGLPFRETGECCVFD
ncbi:MAG: hypothetical protein M1269_12265 [Chloroflexi bacterium]|nr:hypothetical protein [Chloroflexota bacterium]